MNDFELFRFVEISNLTPPKDGKSVIHVNFKEEIKLDPELEDIANREPLEVEEWAREFSVSESYINSWQIAEFPLAEYFGNLDYPNLPVKDQLTGSVDDVASDERYIKDLKNLRRSLFAMKTLCVDAIMLRRMEYAYMILKLLPDTENAETSKTFVISYGIRKKTISIDSDHPSESANQEPDQIEGEITSIEELINDLVETEEKHEKSLFDAKDELKRSKLELSKKIPAIARYRYDRKTAPKETVTKGIEDDNPSAAIDSLKEQIKQKQHHVYILAANPVVAKQTTQHPMVVKHRIRANNLSPLMLANELDRKVQILSNKKTTSPDKCCSNFPTIDGNFDKISVLGMGNLIVVRDRLIKYVTADISHIENVLSKEKKSRVHTVKRTREEFFEQVTSDESIAVNELESTSSYELNKQISMQLSSTLGSNVGAQGGGSYGPVANFSANASASASLNVGTSTNQVDNFSREVIEKATEEVRKNVTSTIRTISKLEVEDVNEHTFDNDSDTNKHGVYCYLQRVSEAQAYTYGERMMLLAYIANPAKDILCVTADSHATPPDGNNEVPVFDVDPRQLNGESVMVEAARFKVKSVAPPPEMFVFVERTYKTDQTSAQQEELSIRSVGEQLLPIFKQYKKWTIADSIDVPDGYKVKTVRVTVNHGSNGLSLPPEIVALPAVVGVAGPGAALAAGIGAAALPLAATGPGIIIAAAIGSLLSMIVPLMMPSIMYSRDSSSVIVAVGNNAQKSNYFFLDSEEMTDVLLELTDNFDDEMSEFLSGQIATLKSQVETFLKVDIKNFLTTELTSVDEIIDEEVENIHTQLTSLVTSVVSLISGVVSINNSGPLGTPALEIDFNKFNEKVEEKVDKIKDAMELEFSTQFSALVDKLNTDLVAPFLNPFKALLDEMGSALSSNFTGPLQEISGIFESSETLHFYGSALGSPPAEKAGIPITLNVMSGNPGITFNVVAILERTERAMDLWRLETYDKLYQGYVSLRDQYEAGLYGAGIGVLPKANPALLRQIETKELKKFAIQALHNHNSNFSTWNIPADKLSFLEHAIEWDNMSAKTIDYGVSCNDKDLQESGLLNYADVTHQEFLKSEVAYVLLPVRPEYTIAINSYLKNGEWSEPDLDDGENIDLYQRMIESAALAKQPKPVGDPIPIDQPTNLVYAKNDLASILPPGG